MTKQQGVSVYADIAIGKIHILHEKCEKVVRTSVENPELELARVGNAFSQAKIELTELYDKTLNALGKEEAAIFSAHLVLLADEELLDGIRNLILTQKVNGEYAVSSTVDAFLTQFSGKEDPIIRERIADLKDVSARLLRCLSGETTKEAVSEPSIVIARELTPSQVVSLDRSKLLALVSTGGSIHSHVAILAKTMGIPALFGIEFEEQSNHHLGIVDGEEGSFILDPEEEILESYRRKKQEIKRQRDMLQEFKNKETHSGDGRSISLFANISDPREAISALENGAEGIGLFRSEFLFLERDSCPSEEEQFSVYRSVAEQMKGKPVVIRTLDLGADKQVKYLPLDPEENTAMGLRGIRVCFAYPEVFLSQLRAILRAAAYGNVAIMFPMISSLWELQKAKEFLQRAREQLEEANLSYGNLSVGTMIETPAAALSSEALAQEVEFFSIGTNDLTQYTLGVDRQNPSVQQYFDDGHPAVFRLIEKIAENGHRNGRRVGICGDLAANPHLTKFFLSLSLDSLSVPPSFILPMRKQISEIKVK